MIDSSRPPRLKVFMRSALEVVFGREGRIGSTVYGTLVVLTALTAAYAAEKHHPWRLVELVITAVVVFWLAYVYADALSQSITHRRRLSRGVVSRVADEELGLVLAAIAPIAALLLAAVGVINEREAIWLAIGVGLVTLFVEGLRYARATSLGRLGTFVILVLNLVFGATIVVLKVLLVH